MIFQSKNKRGERGVGGGGGQKNETRENNVIDLAFLNTNMVSLFTVIDNVSCMFLV